MVNKVLQKEIEVAGMGTGADEKGK